MEENTKEINITKEDLIEAYIFLKKTLYYENNMCFASYFFNKLQL